MYEVEGIISSRKAGELKSSQTDDYIECAALAIYSGEGTLGRMYTFFAKRNGGTRPGVCVPIFALFFQPIHR